MSTNRTKLFNVGVAFALSAVFNLFLFVAIATFALNPETPTESEQATPLRIVQLSQERTPVKATSSRAEPSSPILEPDTGTTQRERELAKRNSLLTESSLSLPSPEFSAHSSLSLATPSLAPGAFEVPVTSRYVAPVLLGVPDLSRYYPRAARERGTEGSTTFKLDVDASGKVTEVAIIASEPLGVFEDAARRLAQHLHFSPATLNGKAVPSTYTRSLMWQIPGKERR